jgi:polysaccharide pyruvyl transferase WcaK-like protein
MTRRDVSEPARDEPRILVENSEYWLSNIGDLAMMDVTVNRLRRRWPGARIGVLTDTPHLMQAYFPDVDPIDPRGSSVWSDSGLLARLSRKAGPRLVGPVAIGWVTARAWLPQKAQGLRRRSRRLLARALVRRRADSSEDGPGDGSDDRAELVARTASPNTLLAARTSSLVLALGGGYLTDQDFAQSTRVLSLLEHAHIMGKPTAMLGQGLGPMEEPTLLARASEVLPSVDFIALRERRKGPALLERVGVATARVAVTGDDAIELANSLRRPDLGGDIGVCLRVAGYSPVSDRARGSAASALQSVALELGSGLVPITIAEYRSQDRRSTLPLLRGFPERRRPLGRFARPQDVAVQVGTCRVMVTGAYHAGVFALAQGIPVVALTSSTYYDDKFLGLVDMFGTGLELLRLDSEDLGERLVQAVKSAWAGAPQVRPALLASAAEQIAASQRGFERACGLLTEGGDRGPGPEDPELELRKTEGMQ